MTAIVAFIAFSMGTMFGALLLAVLGANRREEEKDEAYKLGFRDCMHGKAPMVDVRK